MIRNLLFIFIVISIFSTQCFANLSEEADYYHEKYRLNNPYEKLVDNQGNGYENLYGVRNFREVLKGVYYRGGANNRYHKDKRRDNMNPLPNDGLENLCQEGFSLGIYYYTKNFDKAKHQINCNTGDKINQLNYIQKTAFDSKNHTPLLEIIYKRIKGEIQGPIYGHCWNGWHASGLIATLALRQFCGWSPQEGLKYWEQNTDGNSSGHSSVKKAIKDFKPLEHLKISEDEQKVICPLP